MAENVEAGRARLAVAADAAGRARSLAGRTSKATPSFLKYLLARFQADGCTGVAASLSYTSLLAIVPLLAIGLAMFAAFPGFEARRQDIIHGLTSSLAPQMSEVVQQYLDRFIRNAGKTTGAGVIGLAVTAVLLIHTIQTAFDRIWGTSARRAKWGRFPIYWALITLGPMLFGISFSISTYFFRTAGQADLYGISTGVRLLADASPYILEAIGFALFYRLMPTRPVRIPDAIWGGLTAAFLFEIVKRLFGLYLHYVPTYQALYGALATIPIFLLWMYLAWVTALVGAEVTAALPEWRSGRRSVAPHHRRGDQLSLALAALVLLKEARAQGAGMRTQQIIRALQSDPMRMLTILETLKAAHIVAYNDRNRWVLSRDLNKLSVHQLCHILGITLSNREVGRTPKIGTLVDRLAQEEAQMLSLSVEEALRSIDAEPRQLDDEPLPEAQDSLEPSLDPAVEPDFEPGLERMAEPRLEPALEPRPEPRLEARPEPRLRARPEPRFESRAEPPRQEPPAQPVRSVPRMQAGQRGIPERPMQERAMPEQRVREQRGPKRHAPEQGRSQQSTGEQRAPEPRLPEQRPPDQRQSEQHQPEQHQPEQRPPDQRAPGPRMTEQPTLEQLRAAVTKIIDDSQ
jgi:membrane protein